MEEFERLVQQYLASIPVPEDGEPEPISLMDISPLPGSFPTAVITEDVRYTLPHPWLPAGLAASETLRKIDESLRSIPTMASIRLPRCFKARGCQHEERPGAPHKQESPQTAASVKSTSFCKAVSAALNHTDRYWLVHV